MSYPLYNSIIRLRVTPDEPEAPDAFVGGPRVRGSKRPHGDAKCAQVRRLIETTTLTYGEIAKQTGVGRASICRWTRDGGWKRRIRRRSAITRRCGQGEAGGDSRASGSGPRVARSAPDDQLSRRPLAEPVRCATTDK